MKETIRAFLEADATLVALLTGGFYASPEVSRQETAGAFDANMEILPCANVKLETLIPAGPHPEAAEQFFAIYFYQRSGFATVRSAVARTFTLLSRQALDATMYEIRLVNHGPEIIDPALECSLVLSRYVAIHKQGE